MAGLALIWHVFVGFVILITLMGPAYLVGCDHARKGIEPRFVFRRRDWLLRDLEHDRMLTRVVRERWMDDQLSAERLEEQIYVALGGKLGPDARRELARRCEAVRFDG